MKKRIAIIATSVIIVATLVVGGTLAFFTDKGTVQNVITMGDVHITLTEPAFAEATDGTLKMGSVMPGQKIAKDPTITNTGSHDAYIRCKVSVTGLNDKQSAELINGLEIGNKWVKSGDYYYYQEILPTGSNSKATLFDTVTIPEQWDNTLANEEFKINITAEAIQADNFTPTKTAAGIIDGWKYSTGSTIEPQSATPESSAT